MEPETRNNLSDRTIWVRILYMLLFTIAFSIAEFLVAVVAVFQAVVVLVTGGVNPGLHTFGKNLSVYITDILHFQTFNSEDLPFPFSDWPAQEPDETKWSAGPSESVATPTTESQSTPLDASAEADTPSDVAPDDDPKAS